MIRLSLLACLLLAGIASAKQYTVKENDKVCLIADMQLSVTITYPKGATYEKATVDLEKVATETSGVCGKSLVIAVTATKTHNLTLNFANENGKATLTTVTFDYSLEDTTVFPGANNSMGTERTSSATLNNQLSDPTTYFQCSDLTFALIVKDEPKESVEAMGKSVKIQAFGVDNGFTGSGNLCSKDVSTTEAPTTAAPTTEPTTTKPLAPTTTTTAPAPPMHDNTFVLKDENGTVCVVMTAQLFNVTIKCSGVEDTYMVHVNDTKVSGECSSVADTMIITENSDLYALTLNFTKIGTNYHLGDVAVKKDQCEAMSSSISADLRAPQANVYRCNAEKKIVVNENATLIMSGVKLQAFRSGNSTDLSGTEYICMEDSVVSNVVPIAVGCALAGLIVIVLIAYIIGRLRRRPYEPV